MIGGRGSRGVSLKNCSCKTLQNGSLHIDEILKNLKAMGYRSASKNLKQQLGIRLYSDKTFVKTAPGTFALKSVVAKPISKKVARKVVSKRKGQKAEVPF